VAESILLPIAVGVLSPEFCQLRETLKTGNAALPSYLCYLLLSSDRLKLQWDDLPGGLPFVSCMNGGEGMKACKIG